MKTKQKNSTKAAKKMCNDRVGIFTRQSVGGGVFFMHNKHSLIKCQPYNPPPPPALNHNKINTITKHFVNACVFTLFQPYLITLNFR